MGNEQSSLRPSLAVARSHGHTPACNLTAPTVLHDMAEILFGTGILHSLQASKEPRHQALITQLQDASVISELQLASPDVFGKPLNSGPAFRTSSLASVISHSPWQKLPLKQFFFHRLESRRTHDAEVSSLTPRDELPTSVIINKEQVLPQIA